MTRKLISVIIAASMAPLSALAAQKVVTMHAVDANGVGKSLGTIMITESPGGAVFTPKLKGLAAGDHGFHVHENPNCGAKEKDGKKVAGLAAGGHYDPKGTKKHEGPKGAGHVGDLPVLVVAADGTATKAVTAPHLKLADLKGRSLMIHAGGDNYSDTPSPLGGGGARVACGVVK